MFSAVHVFSKIDFVKKWFNLGSLYVNSLQINSGVGELSPQETT